MLIEIAAPVDEGDPDERRTELAWYENPSWERHLIIKDAPRTINLDAYDDDGAAFSKSPWVTTSKPIPRRVSAMSLS